MKKIQIKRMVMRLLAIVFAGSAASVGLATPAVKWLDTVHDFGAFDEDTKHKQATFRLVNDGDEDMVIISAVATCGCTVPKYDSGPIAPGDTTIISVSYDPSGRPGRFEKFVYVRTSATDERERLTLRGTVIGNAETIGARYPVSMGSLQLSNGAVMCGRVYVGHKKVVYADAYNRSADSLLVVYSNVPDYLSIKMSPAVIPPEQQAQIDIVCTIDGTIPMGLVTDSVTVTPIAIGNADASDPQSYQLRVMTMVEEDFGYLTPEQRATAPVARLSADRIDLGQVDCSSGQPASGEVTLTNGGETEMAIRRVYTADRGLDVSVDAETLRPGESCTIRVSRSGARDIINDRVTVITNDPVNAVQTLRVVGQCK